MLRPWREVTTPHDDVLKGRFLQSEFAADLTRVHQGLAADEYGDPTLFYARTYITEGMRLLLDSVIRRLCATGGDPVMQLQTAFGGGKTHTMLAVYHLAKGQVPVDDLPGLGAIVDAAGVVSIPRATVVVLDGSQQSPNQPTVHDGYTIRTLWGELASQLGGKSAYEMVRGSDESGTAPGKGLLAELLAAHAPCVILIDELVAYLRQFQDGQSYTGGTFESNLSFVQALTEAARAVPSAMILASLPESENELGGSRAQLALDALEKVFGRVQALWKPVGADESFEIVRRRLFTSIVDERAMEETCRAYADLYLQYPNEFPLIAQEVRYAERLKESYPIHPAIFDALYEVWSAMDKFQRTRGVLRLMAKVIHKLWTDGSVSPLIQPGDVPLDHPDVRNDLLYYLSQGWDPVIEREVDGPRSETSRLDQDTRFGAVRAARRVARTIFIEAAPDVPSQAARGVEVGEIILGCMQPGQAIGVYKDALRRMADTMHYLNTAGSRYYYDIRPNLRREMEGRKVRIQKAETEVTIRDLIGPLLGRHAPFEGVHIFTSSIDVPDDEGLRLVVLPTDAAYSQSAPDTAIQAATAILATRGGTPRHHQNRLIFLAANQDVVNRLRDQVRIMMAWNSIHDDIAAERLNLDGLQSRQVEQQLRGAREVVSRTLQDAYKRVLVPYQEVRPNKGVDPVRWEAMSLASQGADPLTGIVQILTDNELLIEYWSPIHLTPQLETWFWKEEPPTILASSVWDAMCRYLYFSRLTDLSVLRRAIEQGVESGAFGVAYGKEGDRFREFAFGVATSVRMGEDLILIRADEARAYSQRLSQQDGNPPITHNGPGNISRDSGPRGGSNKGGPFAGGSSGGGEHRDTNTSGDDDRRYPPVLHRYYGVIKLDAMTAKLQFAEMYDAILKHFATRPDAVVEITVEMQGTSLAGFDEDFQRVIKENMRQLRFHAGEFEDQ
jgi:predicted AAA+ superfamily ATPase